MSPEESGEARRITWALLGFAALCVVSAMSPTVEDWVGWFLVGVLALIGVVALLSWLVGQFREWWR